MCENPLVNGIRKKCKSCIYREDTKKRGCNFMYLTGKMRGCSAENCTRYEKGPKMTKANAPAWSGNNEYEY